MHILKNLFTKNFRNEHILYNMQRRRVIHFTSFNFNTSCPHLNTHFRFESGFIDVWLHLILALSLNRQTNSRNQFLSQTMSEQIIQAHMYICGHTSRMHYIYNILITPLFSSPGLYKFRPFCTSAWDLCMCGRLEIYDGMYKYFLHCNRTLSAENPVIMHYVICPDGMHSVMQFQ